MPRRLVRLAPPVVPTGTGTELRAGFDAARAELDVPTAFSEQVLAEAQQAARAPRLTALDAMDVPFVTIDPPGSTDLDQAMSLSREGSGFIVRYAIADVAAFVDPGGAVDAEAHRRVETLYAPDLRTTLHPPVLCEQAASLLPDGPRPALLWEIHLDADGEAVQSSVRRAMVRSRAKLSYQDVQRALDAGTAVEWALLLRDIGRLRIAREAARGGVSLPIPEQEVVPTSDGYRLELRSPLPVEGWNAQISLLTGMVAARMALDGGVGIVRTLPPPAAGAPAALRRSAQALDVAWAVDESYPDLVRRLDPTVPAHAALLQEATGLMRGAGYAVVGAQTPKDGAGVLHAAIAGPYSHVTAPLRRLVDRYAGEVCIALCAGTPVPDWALAALPALPEEMARGDQRGAALNRACVDLAEAAALQGREGEVFDAVAVDVSTTGASVVLDDPVVRARSDGPGQVLGERFQVRLVEASVADRRVRFAPA